MPDVRKLRNSLFAKPVWRHVVRIAQHDGSRNVPEHAGKVQGLCMMPKPQSLSRSSLSLYSYRLDKTDQRSQLSRPIES